jgi:hypothetical protein
MNNKEKNNYYDGICIMRRMYDLPCRDCALYDTCKHKIEKPIEKLADSKRILLRKEN